VKLSFNIESIIYKALNVAAVTDFISGDIYKGITPAKSQLQDIEIKVLTNNNKYLQNGYVNINFYCQQIREGIPDNKKLSEVTTILMNLIDKKNIQGILFDVESQTGAIKDQEPGRDGIFFTNLKVKFNTI